MTAVARVLANKKGEGGSIATKGEMAQAAKEDIRSAVETWAQTKDLKDPKLPPGTTEDEVSTAYKMGVSARKFIMDPETHKISVGRIAKNTAKWTQQASTQLPDHLVKVAHAALVDKIADGFDDFVRRRNFPLAL